MGVIKFVTLLLEQKPMDDGRLIRNVVETDPDTFEGLPVVFSNDPITVVGTVNRITKLNRVVSAEIELFDDQDGSRDLWAMPEIEYRISPEDNAKGIFDDVEIIAVVLVEGGESMWSSFPYLNKLQTQEESIEEFSKALESVSSDYRKQVEVIDDVAGAVLRYQAGDISAEDAMALVEMSLTAFALGAGFLSLGDVEE